MKRGTIRVKTLSVKNPQAQYLVDFPNFSTTGSITGMRNQYYGLDSLLIRCGSYIYYVGNLSDKDGEVLPLGKTIYFHYAN
mgnify:CR=1 FL=1